MEYLQKIEDRVSYLTGLIRLSKANGEIAPEEKLYVSSVAENMGLNAEEIEKIRNLWESDKSEQLCFSSKGEAAFFIQGAIQLCSVDGCYDEAERLAVRTIASEIGISETDIAEIEAWVAEGVAWKARGDLLIKKIAVEL